MLRDNPVLWLAAIAIWIALLMLVILEAFAVTGHAVTLQITGQSTGQGIHSLYWFGDRLNATIFQGNNSTWLINATGASA
ncbi:MAG TPA: hypothetical protein PLQ01_10215 [Methanothrix sp.]|nr:hypothetical protein [Methanothrix sp.]